MTRILVRRAKGEKICDLASAYGVHRSTLYRRIATFEREGRLARKKSPRRGKITSAQARSIRTNIQLNPFATLAQIKATNGLSVGIKTISRLCKKLFGLTKFVSPRKFFFDESVCEARFNWALVRRRWSNEFWSKVVFCDEVGINNSGSMRKLVFRERGQRFRNRLIYRHANRSLKVNLFAFITSRGPGNLYPYDRMNSPTYCDMIAKMIHELRETLECDDFLIVHDNAPWADSIETYVYLRNNDLLRYFIPFPTYSPDLNLIENMFGLLKQKVREDCFQNGQIRSAAAFLQLVRSSWASIGSQTVDHLYQSIPARLEAVIMARGAATKY